MKKSMIRFCANYPIQSGINFLEHLRGYPLIIPSWLHMPGFFCFTDVYPEYGYNHSKGDKSTGTNMSLQDTWLNGKKKKVTKHTHTHTHYTPIMFLKIRGLP